MSSRVPESVEQADVVLLNRVVCCSPDGIALVRRAAGLTRRTLVLSFPRDVLWVRAGLRLVNIGMRVLGRSFRVFLHSPTALVRSAEDGGLAFTESGRGRFWEFAAFHREP